jgi:hypothetical protein
MSKGERKKIFVFEDITNLPFNFGRVLYNLRNRIKHVVRVVDFYLFRKTYTLSAIPNVIQKLVFESRLVYKKMWVEV